MTPKRLHGTAKSRLVSRHTLSFSAFECPEVTVCTSRERNGSRRGRKKSTRGSRRLCCWATWTILSQLRATEVTVIATSPYNHPHHAKAAALAPKLPDSRRDEWSWMSSGKGVERGTEDPNVRIEFATSIKFSCLSFVLKEKRWSRQHAWGTMS